MIKPIKPIKPKKPKLLTPTRSVVEDFYLYCVDDAIYQDGDWIQKGCYHYELVKEDMIPMKVDPEDGEEYPDYDYSKAENVSLSDLLKLLKDKNIDVNDVVIDNQVYYRKCNGQLVLHISRTLNDADYQNWVDGNTAQMEQYERDKEAHPALMEEYKKQKKLWDIHQAELKLQELKNEE